jgi:hypothetical protein
MPKLKSHRSADRRPSKIRAVPINLMKVPPALYTQRRFRKAWGDELAQAMDLNKLGFPIMNHRDGIYWVCDGQHRIYALQQCGFENEVLDCEVYEGLTDEEMADIFLGRDDRRPIASFDKFHVACTAGHTRENSIRRVVESNALKVSQSKEENCVGAVASLGKVYDRSGDVVLGQVLRTIKRAYGGDHNAFDAQLIDGLGLVYHRYNGKTDEADMVNRLSNEHHGVRGILRKAEALRERLGNQKAQCVAAAIVDVYNKGVGPRAKDRLASWWSVDTSATAKAKAGAPK